MKKIALIAAAACLAVTSASFAAEKKAGPTKAEVGAAVTAAVKAVEDAKAHKGEWRDSYKILGKAKKAYRKGDYATAMKLAKKVEKQGHLGKAQAMAEAHATHASLK